MSVEEIPGIVRELYRIVSQLEETFPGGVGTRRRQRGSAAAPQLSASSVGRREERMLAERRG